GKARIEAPYLFLGRLQRPEHRPRKQPGKPNHGGAQPPISQDSLQQRTAYALAAIDHLKILLARDRRKAEEPERLTIDGLGIGGKIIIKGHLHLLGSEGVEVTLNLFGVTHHIAIDQALRKISAPRQASTRAPIRFGVERLFKRFQMFVAVEPKF